MQHAENSIESPAAGLLSNLPHDDNDEPAAGDARRRGVVHALQDRLARRRARPGVRGRGALGSGVGSAAWEGGVIRPDMREFDNAVRSARAALRQRAVAKAIRRGETHLFNATCDSHEQSARRYERDVRLIANRAMLEAAARMDAEQGLA